MSIVVAEIEFLNLTSYFLIIKLQWRCQTHQEYVTNFVFFYFKGISGKAFLLIY